MRRSDFHSHIRQEKENKVQIIIRNSGTHQILAVIEPPSEIFKSISLIQFSPSGKFLVVGNENNQCFYVYELFPSSGIRTNGPSGPNSTNLSLGLYPRNKRESVRLQYYLFRGYTMARVTDISFVGDSNCSNDLEQILVINTSNGTSHIYNLNK